MAYDQFIQCGDNASIEDIARKVLLQSGSDRALRFVNRGTALQTDDGIDLTDDDGNILTID